MGEESLMKDYRVTVKVRNNRILKAIEESGGVVGRQWCEAHGLRYGAVNLLINLTISPVDKNGVLRPVAARLCEVLNKIPDDLWSSDQLYPLERNFSEMEMDMDQIVALLPDAEQSYLPDFSEVENSHVMRIISNPVARLTPREIQVMKLRYLEDKTLEEVGRNFDLCRQQIGQIEYRALRKIRRVDGRDNLWSALCAINEGFV